MADFFGTTGDDVLSGTSSADTLFGGDGNDTLDGLGGTDLLRGEAGDDILVQVGPPSGPENYNGGDGNDTLLLIGVPAPTPAGLTSQFNFLGVNQIVGVETVEIQGGAGTRTNVLFQISQAGSLPTHFIGGDGGANIVFLTTVAGTFDAPLITVENFQSGTADRFVDDTLVMLASGPNAVTFNASAANRGYVTTLNGGAGNDVLNGGNGREIFVGGLGQDQMYGGGNQDTFLFVNNAPPGFTPQTDTFSGDLAVGGSGYDVAAFGGTVFFQGSLAEIEEIALLPEFAGERPAAQLYLSTGVDLGTVLTRISGTGFVSMVIEAGDTFDGSSLTIAPGSDLLFEITGNDDAELITGTSTDDRIYGGIGNDTLNGGGGDDQLVGGDGFNILNGGAGDDVLGGFDFSFSAGVNAMSGGQGNDVYIVTNVGDVVMELNGQGFDLVESSVNFTLGSGVEVLLLNSFATMGVGNSLDNLIDSSATFQGGLGTTLRGNGGNDILIGSEDSDRLFGGNGNDGLNGGFGSDYLHGGAGADVYAFDLRSLMEPTTVDRIVGFSQAEGDVIDFTLLDTIEHIDAFVGTSAFSGSAREVRYQQVGANTFVQVDWDADGTADFSIRVDGVVNFVAGDFVL